MPLIQKREILICFADPSESQVLRRVRPDLSLLHTGMGKLNAQKALANYLLSKRPKMILSSGFAGGLNPSLTVGSLLYESDSNHPLSSSLKSLDIKAGKFHSAEKVATTAGEKTKLWKATQCDAVEMESLAIKNIADSEGIPFLTLRVISDAANETLPLDFNQLMTTQMRISLVKLAWQVTKKPQLVPQLIRFNQGIRYAAKQLATSLSALIPATTPNSNNEKDAPRH